MVYILLFINTALIIFVVLVIERLVMIMKANTLSELLKYKQEKAKWFETLQEDDGFI